MNVYPLSAELRRRWCLVPGITPDQVLRLRACKPSGSFKKPALAAEMAVSDIHDLADLALCLPEEILSLPNVQLATLLKLQADLIERLDTGPLITGLTEDETSYLATLGLPGAYLPRGTHARLKGLGITTLASLGATSPAILLAQGLTLPQVRSCRRSIEVHLAHPSEKEAARAYRKRPLPPGLGAMGIRSSRLMLGWVGEMALMDGLTTFADLMQDLPTRPEVDVYDGDDGVVRMRQFHIALAAKRLIAAYPDGETQFRIPYQTGIPPRRLPLFGDLTREEHAFLDTVRITLDDGREHGCDHDAGAHQDVEIPTWIYAMITYGLDTLSFVTEADLPYLFEAMGQRRDDVCDCLIAVRHALMEHATPGSGDVAYGRRNPSYDRFTTQPHVNRPLERG
jgi:hypothetical protein